jgi:hypothetical protein
VLRTRAEFARLRRRACHAVILQSVRSQVRSGAEQRSRALAGRGPTTRPAVPLGPTDWKGEPPIVERGTTDRRTRADVMFRIAHHLRVAPVALTRERVSLDNLRKDSHTHQVGG